MTQRSKNGSGTWQKVVWGGDKCLEKVSEIKHFEKVIFGKIAGEKKSNKWPNSWLRQYFDYCV